MAKPPKKRSSKRFSERRHQLGRANLLPAASLIPKLQMEKLLVAKEAAIHGMRQEYRSTKLHFKIERTIHVYFFPELLRGIEAYLKARRNRSAEGAVSTYDEIYLREGFFEHMRNWQSGIATNYRGPNRKR